MNVNGMHATTADTEPSKGTSGGGAWVVKCHDCDWNMAGWYSLCETYGLCLAHRLGTGHENESVRERAR